MAVIAKLKYLRIAPRKVRLVADLIKKKNVERAQAILSFTTKKSALSLLKLLNSAIANARHNFQIEAKNLYVSKIDVDEGPKYKRWMPRARGMAYPIQKKTSHITLVLDEISPSKKIKKIKKEIKKPEQKKEPQKEKLHPPKFSEKIWEGKPKIAKGLKRIFRRKAF